MWVGARAASRYVCLIYVVEDGIVRWMGPPGTVLERRREDGRVAWGDAAWWECCFTGNAVWTATSGVIDVPECQGWMPG